MIGSTSKDNYLWNYMTYPPKESTSSSSHFHSIPTTKETQNQYYISDESEKGQRLYPCESQTEDRASRIDFEAENSSHKGPEPERCKVHNKKLQYVCWQDQEKICSKCVILGPHKESKCPDIRSLDELNQAILPTKRQCEDLIPIIDTFWAKAEALCQEQKKDALNVIQKRFNELRFMLNAKEAEFVSEINSFIDREIQKHRWQVGDYSFVKLFLKERIDDYEAITQKAKPFELLEEELETTFKIIRETLNLNVISQMEEVMKQIKYNIDSKLSTQLNALEKIGMWTEDLNLMCQEIDLKLNEKLYSRQELQKYKERLYYDFELQDNNNKGDVVLDGDKLVISYPFEGEVSRSLNLKKHMKAISSLEFRIRRVSDSLEYGNEDRLEKISQEDISNLCYIRSKLGELKQIQITSEKYKISDEALLNLFSCLFWKNDSLTGIYLTYKMEGVFDKSLSYLAQNVLTTAKNLNTFYLHFDNCQMSHRAFVSLSQSLSQRAQNLTSLHLVFESEFSYPWKELFVSMPNLESFAFQISCKRREVLHERFISETLPSLKRLKSFQFFINDTTLDTHNLSELLSSFPEEWFLTLNQFRMNLSGTRANDESLEEFVEIALEKFKALKAFAIYADGSEVSSEMKEKISQWEKKISDKLSLI